MYRENLEDIAWEIEDKIWKSSLESTAVEAVLQAMIVQIRDIIDDEGYDVDADAVRDIISSEVFKQLNI